MKSFRIILTAFAFVLAIGGATASNSLFAVTNTGATTSGRTFTTIQVDVCDNSLTDGIQCTIRVDGVVRAAKIKGNETEPLFRPE